MEIIRSSGLREPIMLDKITQALERVQGDLKVEPVEITKRVALSVADGMTTAAINNLVAETAAAMTPIHPDYGMLAGRVAAVSLHRTTSDSFSETIELLSNYVHPKNGMPFPLIGEGTRAIVKKYAAELDAAIDYSRDLTYDYFAFKTLEKAYLLKMDGKTVERPQHLLMRVAVGVHHDDLDSILRTYDMMSRGLFTHASPTLFNAGTMQPQMSSCFLAAMKDDSLEGIYDTLKQVALISKSGSGLAVHIHNIRAKGAFIKGNNGVSAGIVPMLRVFNETARYVDQAGKRRGAFAIYLEPWHADIFEFLDLRKNHGKEEMRARDLFYGLWIPDLFMERVKQDADWALMDPSVCPGLSDVYGDAFTTLYEKYEAAGKFERVVKARELWFKVIEAQIETGTPYIGYKDAINRKSNQKNIGVIKSSNLCHEIFEVSTPDETAVCNLSSLALPKMVENGKFDHQKLYEVAYQAVFNMNRVIDHNHYPVPETKRSNERHRPVGLGIQGLADTFIMLRYPFDSEKARQLNKDIFETMYFAALHASADLAQVEGPYETFEGSPASQGILQFDMWGVTPSNRWDWQALREKIALHGLRNSLLIALMPTATTGQILGNNECFEPYTSNIYVRRVLSGEFVVVNKHLVRDLEELGLWNDRIRNKIIAGDGSVQHIPEIPEDIRDLYKTSWEISQKTIIDLAADRGAYVCQGQSMNLFVRDPNFAKITSMHFYAWEKGLKTGMYYLRSQAASQAVKFTLDQAEKVANNEDTLEQNQKDMLCSLNNPESCEACGS
ncbi:ribonucleoside-diphosphate reductase subunit alpha [Candidatus Gracilibacteria bacterium CG17_big_fil_post_rev_8_21_14_2_50_48_13]|nr:MAG: ribonucleoside-diphosphate reductase subunit alpha [Candidatus Gracilibacteria bacterium CG17_big_fil_post_rev_8_21_14_2_50_48_13]